MKGLPAYIGIKDAYAYRHRPECMRALADFFWRILLCAAFVILVLSLVFGIRELFFVVKGDSTVSGSPTIIQPAPKLDKKQLQNALSAFSEREARFNALKTNAPKKPDPSR